MIHSKPRTGYDKKIYQQHLDRIKNVKKTIDNNEPKKKTFINKYKVENKINENRIQYENRLMLERIAKSIQSHQLDNSQSKSHTLHYQFMRKLSNEKRIRNMNEITQNNHKLLDNIVNVRPEYNHLEFEEDYKRKHKKMVQMLIYPELYQNRIDNNV